MRSSTQTLLAEYKSGLYRIYGKHLKNIYLFGSFARGEETIDSDVDVLIILSDLKHYGAEIQRTSQLTSDLSLKNNITISRVFVAERNWQAMDSPLLRNVHVEGKRI